MLFNKKTTSFASITIKTNLGVSTNIKGIINYIKPYNAIFIFIILLTII